MLIKIMVMVIGGLVFCLPEFFYMQNDSIIETHAYKIVDNNAPYIMILGLALLLAGFLGIVLF